jgi:hypothetical protein
MWVFIRGDVVMRQHNMLCFYVVSGVVRSAEAVCFEQCNGSSDSVNWGAFLDELTTYPLVSDNPLMGVVWTTKLTCFRNPTAALLLYEAQKCQTPALQILQIPALRNTLSVHAAVWLLTPNSHNTSGTLLLSLARERQLISVVHWQDIYEH